MKALHFGAGNIGRGFIGYLLKKSGYDLTFVDISEELVTNINRLGRYHVITIGASKTSEEVSNVNAISLNDFDGLVKAVEDTDLITLSIGANNLKSTGELLQRALMQRLHSGNEKRLDGIACENALFATNILKEAVLENAGEDLKAYLDGHVGFPNCAVDRIVPNVNLQKESPIDVVVEDFYEWDVESGEVLVNRAIEGVNYVKNLMPYLERIIFLLNGSHALIAYYGYRKHYRFVHEAIQDPEVRAAVQEYQKETMEALNRKHGLDLDELRRYSRKLIGRFENTSLQDELVRVGRDPVRKLSGNDRLVSPLKLCSQYGISCDGIAFAIAAGLAFDYDRDPKAMEIQKSIVESGIENTIHKVTGLDEGSQLAEKIARKYRDFVRQ